MASLEFGGGKYPKSNRPDFPSRELIARVTRVDELSKKPHRRISVEFDAIDNECISAGSAQLAQAFKGADFHHFGLLRIVTTEGRFRELYVEPPVPGRWYRLAISSIISSGLPTWFSPLSEQGYVAHARGYTSDIENLEGPDDEPSPSRSVGAAAVLRSKVPKKLTRFCAIPAHAFRSWLDVNNLLEKVPKAETLLVRDVGQGSFATLMGANDLPLVHFDVGAPTSFNARTFPRRMSVVRASQSALVLLSHWDWDHLHAAYLYPTLLDCKWIVPEQMLGPGAGRLATELAARGNLYVWPQGKNHQYRFGEVGGSLGPVGGAANDTGLSLRATLMSGSTVLLTGDAEYNLLPSNFTKPVTHLVGTHHGAKFRLGQEPRPLGGVGCLVLSYGRRNVYRHPNQDALNAYLGIGWPPHLSTAARPKVARGDKKFS
jgi:competence protein ComEC